MDALGLLGSLGSLGALIPNLKFVGAYYGHSNSSSKSVSVSTWKFGVTSIGYSASWELGNNTTQFSGTFLVVPGMSFHPLSGHVIFSSNSVSTERSEFAALLFNY